MTSIIAIVVPGSIESIKAALSHRDQRVRVGNSDAQVQPFHSFLHPSRPTPLRGNRSGAYTENGTQYAALVYSEVNTHLTIDASGISGALTPEDTSSVTREARPVLLTLWGMIKLPPTFTVQCAPN